MFFHKAIVYCSQRRMCKISKQRFKGHITDIMSILMCFFLPFKTDFVHFLLTIEYLRNKWGSSTIGQIGKATFTTEFLTVTNTL